MLVSIVALSAAAAGRPGGGGTEGLSPLARALLADASRAWVRMEAGGFQCWAGSTAEAAQALEEAEEAWDQIERHLGRGPRGGVIRLFILSDKDLWNRVVRGADRRRDSVAVQAGDEVFILREAGHAWELPRLAHELVHVKLWRRYGRRVPLWLDEGLATYLGWTIAEDRAWKKGEVLSRRRIRIPAAERRTPAGVQAVRGYEGVSPSFYAQAEALVVAAMRNQEPTALGALASAVVEDGLSWEEYLRRRVPPGQDAERVVNEIVRTWDRKIHP